MRPTTRLIAIVLFAIVAVEFGGWSLLGLLTGRGSLSPFQEQFFRAGHGHAGVLLILALVFLLLVERTSYSRSVQLWLSITLLGGVLLQSGGFFVHLMQGEEGSDSIGTAITTTGALLIAAALIGLGIGILRGAESTTT